MLNSLYIILFRPRGVKRLRGAKRRTNTRNMFPFLTTQLGHHDRRSANRESRIADRESRITNYDHESRIANHCSIILDINYYSSYNQVTCVLFPDLLRQCTWQYSIQRGYQLYSVPPRFRAYNLKTHRIYDVQRLLLGVLLIGGKCFPSGWRQCLSKFWRQVSIDDLHFWFIGHSMDSLY